MTGIVYADDCQIVSLSCDKRYSEKPGLSIRIMPLQSNDKRQKELDEFYEGDIGEGRTKPIPRGGPIRKRNKIINFSSHDN